MKLFPERDQSRPDCIGTKRSSITQACEAAPGHEHGAAQLVRADPCAVSGSTRRDPCGWSRRMRIVRYRVGHASRDDDSRGA